MNTSLAKFAAVTALGAGLLGAVPAAASADTGSAPEADSAATTSAAQPADDAKAKGGAITNKNRWTTVWSGIGDNAKPVGKKIRPNVTTTAKCKEWNSKKKQTWYRQAVEQAPDHYVLASNFRKPTTKIGWC